MDAAPPLSNAPTSAGSRAAKQALARAIAAAAQRRYADARALVDEALALRPDDPVVLAVAGVVAFVTHDHHASLVWLERAGRLANMPRIEWLVRERATRLGWDLDARAAMERAAAAEPDEPRWHAALVAHYAQRRSIDAAIREGERTLGLAPDSASTAMELAGMHADRGDRAAVERCLAQAFAIAETVPMLLESARLFRIVGAFDEARARWESVLARAPDDATATLGLAELALWSGDHARATQLVTASDSLARSVARERILGSIAFLEGRREEAKEHLHRALAREPKDAEVHAWLAQIAILEGRFEEGHDHVSSAIEGGSGTLFAGHVLRLRVKLEERHDEAYPDPHYAHHHRASFRAICPGSEPVLLGNDRSEWKAVLEEALVRMHGNRSSVATYLDDGVLRLVPNQRDPRRESRRVLNRVRVDDAATLLAELDALAEAFPHSGLPLAHKGELLLWLGRVDEAEVELRHALQIVRGTRWAYIGLGAVALLRNDPRGALRILEEGVQTMHGTTGPAVYVHRAEANYLLGRLDDAEADLAVAIELNPTRISGHLVRSLVSLERGDLEGARRSAAAFFRNAPGLASDAARELGLPPGTDAPVQLEAGALRAFLLHVRTMLRGNRSSSCISYVTAEGRMRFDTRGGMDPHARDTLDLELASVLLRSGLDALPQPGRSQPARRSVARSPGAGR